MGIDVGGLGTAMILLFGLALIGYALSGPLQKLMERNHESASGFENPVLLKKVRDASEFVNSKASGPALHEDHDVARLIHKRRFKEARHMAQERRRSQFEAGNRDMERLYAGYISKIDELELKKGSADTQTPGSSSSPTGSPSE